LQTWHASRHDQKEFDKMFALFLSFQKEAKRLTGASVAERLRVRSMREWLRRALILDS